MPAGVVGVSESGLQTRDDLERLAAAGYRAFLIGERFMTDADPARAIAGLIGVGSHWEAPAKMTPILKICGMTRVGRRRARRSRRRDGDRVRVLEGKSALYRAGSCAGEIAAALPSTVTTVGVFVNESVDGIRETARKAQACAWCSCTARSRRVMPIRLEQPILRSVTLDDVSETARAWPAGTMLLLDSADPARRGSGRAVVDWSRAAQVAREQRVVLAGGLTPDNIEEAILTVRPIGVDVSSGVESAPGVKDLDKVARFLANARAAFARMVNCDN